MEGKKMSAATLKENADFTDKNDWNIQFEWFKTHLEKFTKHFKPEITKI
jgi:hypothetical protein